MEVPNGKVVQSPMKKLVKPLADEDLHTAITGTAHHTQGFPKSSGLGYTAPVEFIFHTLDLFDKISIICHCITHYVTVTKLKQKPLVLLKTQSWLLSSLGCEYPYPPANDGLEADSISRPLWHVLSSPSEEVFKAWKTRDNHADLPKGLMALVSQHRDYHVPSLPWVLFSRVNVKAGNLLGRGKLGLSLSMEEFQSQNVRGLPAVRGKNGSYLRNLSVLCNWLTIQIFF